MKCLLLGFLPADSEWLIILVILILFIYLLGKFIRSLFK
nr:MAG TPA: FeoB-associated Cys-rich membrane protein [Microviridae sp.]